MQGNDTLRKVSCTKCLTSKSVVIELAKQIKVCKSQRDHGEGSNMREKERRSRYQDETMRQDPLG